jgi:hypothetical protein
MAEAGIAGVLSHTAIKVCKELPVAKRWQLSDDVAQVSNLPYRRFPIGSAP